MINEMKGQEALSGSHPCEDARFHADELVGPRVIDRGAFTVDEILNCTWQTPTDVKPPIDEGASGSKGERHAEREGSESGRIPLEERLRLIKDKPKDITYLFGTSDGDLLGLMSAISPRLQILGSVSGYGYVNPARSLAQALKGKGACDIDMGVLDRVFQTTTWLADAWENEGSLTAMEVMRNLVLREVLVDPEMRSIILSRIERGFESLCAAYDDAGYDPRKRKIF